MDNVKNFYKRINDKRVFDLSAQCAYYFLFSLFPFLIVLVTMLSYLPINTQEVLLLTEKYIPSEINKILEPNIHNILDVKRTGLLSLGFFLSLWSISRAISSMMYSLDLAYDVKKKRSILNSIMTTITLMLVMMVVIIVAFVLNVFGKNIGLVLLPLITDIFGDLYYWDIIRLIISFIVLLLAFTMIYLLAPNRKLKIKEILIGSLFATIGWQFISMLFSMYISKFDRISITYGSLGGFILLMVWFYLSAMILIIGGQINAYLLEKRAK